MPVKNFRRINKENKNSTQQGAVFVLYRAAEKDISRKSL